jgi:hypothetical protein
VTFWSAAAALNGGAEHAVMSISLDIFQVIIVLLFRVNVDDFMISV